MSDLLYLLEQKGKPGLPWVIIETEDGIMLKQCDPLVYADNPTMSLRPQDSIRKFLESTND